MSHEDIRKEIDSLIVNGTIKSADDLADYVARKAEEAVMSSPLLSEISDDNDMSDLIMAETAWIAAAIINDELGLRTFLAAIASMDVDRMYALVPTNLQPVAG